MGDTANKAQKFLLDNNCGDLILNDVRDKKADDRIYASDIMMKFLESERKTIELLDFTNGLQTLKLPPNGYYFLYIVSRSVFINQL